MFKGLDTVFVGSDKKGDASYKTATFERIWFEYLQTDASEEFGKNVNKVPQKVPDQNGTVFVGLRPKSGSVTVLPIVDGAPDISKLLSEAHDLCAEDAKEKDEDGEFVFGDLAKHPEAGWLLLLKRASIGKYQDDIVPVRASITTPASKDPNVIRARQAKNMIDEFASRGKTITMENAYARLRRNAINEYVDDDGMSVEAATDKVNAEWGIVAETAAA
jgi:hypothetical protein